jgi:hypothetical protein
LANRIEDFGLKLREAAAFFLTQAHQFTDGLVGRPKRYALQDQKLHQSRRIQVAVFQAGGDAFAVETAFRDQARSTNLCSVFSPTSNCSSSAATTKWLRLSWRTSWRITD